MAGEDLEKNNASCHNEHYMKFKCQFYGEPDTPISFAVLCHCFCPAVRAAQLQWGQDLLKGWDTQQLVLHGKSLTTPGFREC